ncbi:MAG: hypothetical protein V7739_06510 [Motiliproteus sp.]
MNQGTGPESNDSPLIAVALWLLLSVSYVLTHSTELMQLDLADTDDYMRLHQVVNWIHGANWYDFNVARLNPPEGVVLHWSRLPDLPLAATIEALSPVFGEQLAIVSAVILVPSLLLLIMVLLLWFGSRAFDNSETAIIASIYLMACIPVLAKLYPGKLDHHGWQLMLMMALWVCLVQACRQHWKLRYGLAAGVVMALSLWVGLETLPIILVLFTFLTLRWVLGTIGVGKYSLVMAVSFALGVSLLLPLHRSPAEIWQSSCDNLAINWILPAWLGSGYFLFLQSMGPRLKRTASRLFSAFAGALVCMLILLAVYPSCLFEGPYGQLSPLLQQEFLSQITEVKGALYYLNSDPTAFVLFLGFPMLVLVAHLFVRTTPRKDLAHQLTLVLLISTFVLSFWQLRCVIFACLFAIPLGARLTHAQRQQTRSTNRRLVSLTWLIMLSPLAPAGLSVLMSQTTGQGSEATVGLGYQAVDQVAKRIAQQPGYRQGRSALIAADTNLGPTILARTGHSVLAAPYHRNQQGMLKLHKLLNSRDDNEALSLTKQFGIDYVLVVAGSGATGGSPFFQRLQQHKPPVWLEALAIERLPDVRLFQVKSEPMLSTAENVVAHSVDRLDDPQGPREPSKIETILSSSSALLRTEESAKKVF